ncbi:MAG: methyltransferase, TIGR04325 family [Alphaproteobacteria bacterium]|nr:methyltransferase, TIGR04325 family [Alphaproteobacteria bacterium]
MPGPTSSPLWSGIHTSFAEVDSTDNPFDAERWESACRGRVERFRSSCLEGPLPPAHDRPTVLPALLAVMPGGPVRVIDFGGGAGMSYLQAARSAPGRVASWTVVERPALCSRLSSLHGVDDPIRFVPSISAAGRADLAVFASSLHYAEDWRRPLAEVAAAGCGTVLLEEVPAVSVPSFATAQRYHEHRIAVWMIGLAELIETMQGLGFVLRLSERFASPIEGLASELPMENFPPTHRVGFASTFLFLRP